MSKSRPKANNTPYKAGDVILLLRDIKKDHYGSGGAAYWAGEVKETVIPANVPVVIEKVNNSHVWLKYKGEVHWVRNIPGRMMPATEAAIVLFGDNNGNK